MFSNTTFLCFHDHRPFPNCSVVSVVANLFLTKYLINYLHKTFSQQTSPSCLVSLPNAVHLLSQLQFTTNKYSLHCCQLYLWHVFLPRRNYRWCLHLHNDKFSQPLFCSILVYSHVYDKVLQSQII
jgi:hypothetical protein